jgi:putative hemolysin
MDSFVFELSGVLVCLLFSALFSASEAVIMSVPVDRTKQLIDEDLDANKKYNFLLTHPTEILTTILIGNSLVNTIIASLVTSVSAKVFNDYSLAIAAGLATVIILIFGEILPKSLARNKAEKMLPFFIRFLFFFYTLLYPGVFALSYLIKTILGNHAHLKSRAVTTDDLEYLINKAEEEQSIDAKHIDLINSILEFPTIKVKEIMVPRNRVDAIDINTSLDNIFNFVRDKEHSRYPLYDKDLNHVVGFMHIKDLFIKLSKLNAKGVQDILMPAFFVYEQMRIQAVFDYMNKNKVHMALVKDETGNLVGLVTLEDIMEEIFGDIADEHDDQSALGQTSVGELESGIVVAADTSIRELLHSYNVDITSSESYSTITGFLLELLGNYFPKQGQIIYWEEYTFELVKVTNYHIDEVKIKKRQPLSENEPEKQSRHQ